MLGRLAVGGMAEVWLARAVGFGGFEKLVVLKTILPGLVDDPSFVQMFVDEARLAAMLNHPNCVQLFELGKEGSTLFIAMEYIEGFALSRVLRQAAAKTVQVPVEVIARVGSDALSGLEHAHRLADREGRPMNLIHRDVSPDNLLISFGGQTKLVDFGIAKAERGSHRATRVGTVKGKAGYIAPEGLRGERIDERADLFAMGVVLYRALTGRRPFTGPTEAAVSLAVLQVTPAAPHTLAPSVPDALSAVVMRALEKFPDARFQSAREMRLALEAATHPAHADAVSGLMSRLWPAGAPERLALVNLATGQAEDSSGPLLESIISQGVELPPGARSTPYRQGEELEAAFGELADLTERREGPATALPATEPVLETPAAPGLAAEPPTAPALPSRPHLMQTVASAPSPALLEATRPPSRPSRPDLFGTVSLAPNPELLRAAAEDTSGPPTVVGVPPFMRGGEENEGAPADVVPPPRAHALDDDDEAPPVRWKRPVVIGGAVTLLLVAVGFLVLSQRQRAQPKPLPPPPAGRVEVGRVEIDVGESVMVISGERELGRSPGPIELPPGRQSLRLIDRSLGIDQTFSVTVKAGETVKLAEKLGVGTLTVRSVPWGFVKLDGRPLGMTPIKARQVYAGVHVLDVYNSEIEMTKHVEVKVESGEARVVQVKLLQ